MFSFLKRSLSKIRSFVAGVLLLMAQVILVGVIAVSSLFLAAVAWDKYGPKYEQYQSNDLPVFTYNDFRNNSPDKKNPIIALVRKDEQGKDQFWCTAFVVSDKLALTAGHCLMDVRRENKMTRDPITVLDLAAKPTDVSAHAAALNIRADMGAIAGDFSKFNKLPLYIFPGGILGLEQDAHFKTCGFAWGSVPVLCTPFELSEDKSSGNNYYMEIMGKGHLYPGMSGGPVINEESGMVIGINTEAHEGSVVFAPTTGILGALQLTTKAN